MHGRLVIIVGGVLLFSILGVQAQEPDNGSAEQQPSGDVLPLPSMSPAFEPPSASFPTSPSELPAFNDSSPSASTVDSDPSGAAASLPSSTHRDTSARRYTLGERYHIYLKHYSEPSFYLPPAIGAAWDQWINTPPQWGPASEAFGRRLASSYARDVISHALTAGFSAFDHEDPELPPMSKLQGFWPRTRYAVLRTLTSPTDGGGETFAFASFVGSYGAAFISNAWYPKPYANTGYALERGTTAIAGKIVINEIREFSPDLRNLLHRHLPRAVLGLLPSGF